ncbi:hypothetical protein [Azospirillum sp. B4]|uniref:hypothetical protein n=1 Tax=Azospirillum sp. B4 TaxID=95605 RepID=UPI00034A059B|nr:hypothetical protein [Azospirillum sp. B4]
MISSRRGFMAGVGLLGVATASAQTGTAGKMAAPGDPTDLQATLDRYASFGDKASGGAGDTACGVWLEAALGRMGYACHRQSFDVPFFEASQATLACGTARATVMPQAIVTPTGPQGLTGPLRLADGHGDLTGAIALIVLPYKRWVGVADPQAAKPLADAVRRGAAGVVLVTTGPSGEAIALNVSTKAPALDRPVALLAPKDADPFLAAADQALPATLTLDGRGGGGERRSAFNLIARLDRGASRTLVISTPRSGWLGCVAERGSGLAVWLSLAKWLAETRPGVNVELIATSGHEYQFLGGELYLHEAAPPPASTKLWVHIGASAAARDWHEFGATLLPLPSVDTERFLTATGDLLDRTRHAFQGVGGLEATYLADKVMAGGELVNVLNAGYGSAIGLYGVHRYFHTRGDDLRCTSAAMVQPVERAFREAIKQALG